MTTTASSFGVRRLIRIAAVVLPVLGMAVVSCQQDSAEDAGPPLGAGGGAQATTGAGGGCIGLDCPDVCAKSPHPGCSCTVEGQHMLCGKVEADVQDQKVCGKGFSVCTNGEWADCIIDNAVTLIPNAPPGYYGPDGFGQATMCMNNPCDPSCVDYQDTPTGLGDAGTGLKATDAGVSLAGDGGSVCVPKTCVDQGKNCGPVSDTCGGLLQCGTCSGANTCGGSGVPSVCGVSATCTNLCLQQVMCPSNGTTSITGVVYAPNGVDPLPNAIVYVPNAPVTPFSIGVSCDNCLLASGSPLVSTTSAVDGSFTLKNMPVGASIPLVIQIGRWRRQVVIPTVSMCANTAVPATLTRFPRNKGEGDIPKMGFVTGSVDGLECVFRKIGIDDAEFTNPSGTGRINFYQGGYSPGTAIGNGSGTPGESTLLSSQATINGYDMLLFPCQGAEYYWTGGVQATYQNNLANYVNAGGRMFTTHYNYIWLYSDNSTYFSPLSGAVNWGINQGAPTPDPQTGYIDQSFPKGVLLAQWLQTVGASSTLGQISINTLRRDFNSVVAPSQRWMTVNSPSANIPMHLTFNTPLGAAPSAQCGRVVFSDFHVENSGNTHFSFPTECGNGAMTPQEKLLEFMLFDLSSCVQPDQMPLCTPITCSAQGLNCGPAGDGCGGTLNCGTCAAPQTCGGGGLNGVCGTPFSYSDGYFVRDYDASNLCPLGSSPVWRLWSWSSVTPSDSHIDFSVQTAATSAAVPAAPSNPVLFSNPPGPAALLNQSTSAHAVNVPSAGQPDTELGSTSIDYTLQQDNLARYNNYLRVTAHLVPSTNKLAAPILSSWDLQVDCQPTE